MRRSTPRHSALTRLTTTTGSLGKHRSFIYAVDRTGTTLTRQSTYTYDVTNQRIAKTVDLDGQGANPAITTRFVYDRNNVALEFTGSATTPSTRYFHGTNVDQVLAQESNNATTWLLSDQIGTTRDLVNNSGILLNHFTYDSFGNQTGSTPNATVDTRYKFTGREFDAETGDYFYRARYYDQETGRFLSEDPIGFQAQDANTYRYSENSPTNFIDPSGLRTEIYIHQGKNWYGHAAINVNGIVYTFGRYDGAQAKPRTLGTKGEGYFYVVTENYYLNSKAFTDPLDEVLRYQLNLSPQEERQVDQCFQNIFQNESRQGTDLFLGQQGQSSQAHGRILKDRYEFLGNNCTTTTLNCLPIRVQNQIVIANMNMQARTDSGDGLLAPLAFQARMISPPQLSTLLNGFVEGVSSLPAIPKGTRRY
jgi:RHS repeat-associated protein